MTSSNQHYGKYWLLLSIFLLSLVSFEGLAKPPILSKRYLNKSPGRVIRTCCAFGSDLKYVGIPFVKRNDIIDKDDLGTHQFMGGKNEKNGIIYTKHGGFIDIGHLRDYADWTAYLYTQMMSNEKELKTKVLKLGNEGGKKMLAFNLADNLRPKDYVQIAGSIAYDLSLWHEIATYFGVSLIPVILPEKFSSFSPEDVYSNLLGTIIGTQAIESEKEYEEAVTIILNDILKYLGAVEDINDSYAAMQEVESIWWDSKKPLPNAKFLLKRNLDTENEILPWLVTDSDKHLAYSLPKPNERYRKMYQLSLDLNEKFPMNEIFPDRDSRVVTQDDFHVFVDYIKSTDEMEKSMDISRGNKPKNRYINLLKILGNDNRRSSK